MKLSASKAAKMANVSVPTITRAIKDGRLSAEKKPQGGYAIEVSELERVFPLTTSDPNATPTKLEPVTPASVTVLEREIELLRERMADKDSTIDDLRSRLDREGEERRKLTAVLTDMRESDEKARQDAPRSWWRWGRQKSA